jgi:hypothetical protein
VSCLTICLQAEDAAARCHSLRRQRLDISWRLVFGLDVQHMVSFGGVGGGGEFVKLHVDAGVLLATKTVASRTKSDHPNCEKKL